MGSGIQPSLTGFTGFVRTNANIGTNYLPDGSPWLQWAYGQAVNIVNPALRAMGTQQGVYTPYTLAVYYLGTHILVEIAQDVSYPVGQASWANGLVTLTTEGSNSIQPGDRVSVSGISPVAYDAEPRRPVQINSVILGQNQITYPVSTNPGPGTVLAGAQISETYFYAARATFGLLVVAPGVVTAASDQGTSTGLLNPEFMKNLTLANLSYMKTPWGQQYMAIAIDYGPSVWGISDGGV